MTTQSISRDFQGFKKVGGVFLFMSFYDRTTVHFILLI